MPQKRLDALLAHWRTREEMAPDDVRMLAALLIDRLAELEAVFAGQPRTADGALLQPGMVIWVVWRRCQTIYQVSVQAVSANGIYANGTTAGMANWWPCADVFKAAEAARKELGQ